jgi:hypothetical protein
MIAVFIASLLVFTPCPEPTPQTIQIVANIIQGESAPALMGEEAATALAWTLRHRCQAEPTQPIQVAARGYYGWAEASPEALAIAAQVWLADDADDPIGGRTLAMSRTDIRGRFGCTDEQIPALDALMFPSPVSKYYQLWMPQTFPADVCGPAATAIARKEDTR